MDATFEDPVCGLANIRLGRAVLQDARVNRGEPCFSRLALGHDCGWS